ncbi:hypothetical protein [Methylocystis rosea]|uniref:hypothetical protein n=1 Tax=Methylocystis rosea TaxID=173366 RepID=UPI0018DBF0BF|nr:hypothetical protein [Methylocystis rosea]
MTYFTGLSNIARSEGDPKVLSSGHSSLTGAHRLAHALGWFSIGLGLTELFAPQLVTRTLGVRGKETLVRAYGLREIGSGVLSLSVDKAVGLQSRLAGDAVDLATLAAFAPRSSRPRAIAPALMALAGVTLLDLFGAFGRRETKAGPRAKAKGAGMASVAVFRKA